MTALQLITSRIRRPQSEVLPVSARRITKYQVSAPVQEHHYHHVYNNLVPRRGSSAADEPVPKMAEILEFKDRSDVTLLGITRRGKRKITGRMS